MIFVILNLLKVVFWPNICSMLENILFAPTKNVYYLINIILFKGIGSIIEIKYVFAHICLIILLIARGVLKSSTMILELAISQFISVKFCPMYF